MTQFPCPPSTSAISFLCDARTGSALTMFSIASRDDPRLDASLQRCGPHDLCRAMRQYCPLLEWNVLTPFKSSNGRARPGDVRNAAREPDLSG